MLNFVLITFIYIEILNKLHVIKNKLRKYLFND